uniref:Uncharacterized protein n=1 Tax=Utricularia reniformis TaxID=192314 RepID=A0A1Y0B0M6_9LAMI|nr:hypothetical protein AEK19_MT0674 [Utricularia reniformis]ART30924.1 hypothetical protein AEK19_MT0674 [Utricularia reniformis]
MALFNVGPLQSDSNSFIFRLGTWSHGTAFFPYLAILQVPAENLHPLVLVVDLIGKPPSSKRSYLLQRIISSSDPLLEANC